MYKILVVCGLNELNIYHEKYIKIIKKYCNNNSITLENCTFINLNNLKSYNQLLSIDLKLLYKPSTFIYSNNFDKNMKQLKKINDKIENNDKLKYDYIIYEHCPINSFNIEYIKYYNILKLNGYLIIYIDGMFNSKLELVNSKNQID